MTNNTDTRTTVDFEAIGAQIAADAIAYVESRLGRHHDESDLFEEAVSQVASLAEEALVAAYRAIEEHWAGMLWMGSFQRRAAVANDLHEAFGLAYDWRSQQAAEERIDMAAEF